MDILEELDLPTPDDLEGPLTPEGLEVGAPIPPELEPPVAPPGECEVVDGVEVDGKDTAKLIRDGEWHEANALLQRAANHLPRKAGVFNNLGCSYYCLEEKTEAKEAFEWAIEAKTKDEPKDSQKAARYNLQYLEF